MKRGDVILLLLLLVALAASWLYINWLNSRPGDQLIAVITLNGDTIREIDLNAVDEPYQFRVDDGNGGYNLIAVERGRIRVIEANCPEQVDVRQGWISQPHQSLVCLPHRLVIRLVSKGGTDVDGIVR